MNKLRKSIKKAQMYADYAKRVGDTDIWTYYQAKADKLRAELIAKEMGLPVTNPELN
jgi:hypothetical protein